MPFVCAVKIVPFVGSNVGGSVIRVEAGCHSGLGSGGPTLPVERATVNSFRGVNKVSRPWRSAGQ